MNIVDFYRIKNSSKKVTVVTCYDYTSARLLSQTSVDVLLVGDSAAMTMHGYKDTISATIDMMALHTQAVARGAGEKYIVADLPFLSYRKSLSKNIAAVQTLMQAGAHAVKLESALGNLKLVSHLAQSGIPVMGHLGLTPQFVHALGGYQAQGKTEASAKKLKEDALLLQEAGCFSIVLECIPAQLAKEITESLFIPTIGIGAGPDTDGQVLVFQDLLGLNIDFTPKFVKVFVNGFDNLKAGVDAYVEAVQSGAFPRDEHCYGN
ncbi:MAG TPA: 3-methyl-2-oxobutanoate hydroxymethyltransferase [Gammaproteobacteria bacterium]|jgi:3-methyl-2-oxobutanoate hydroxymethyltransferase|nr:3-methyl-2-oxobutanoate hydroxymethyltransferase [Gammaproteobacteria bacterium]